MFWSQLMEVCEDILVNRNQMFHCSLERDDNQRQACTSKRCSIIKTCRRSAKLNTLIIKDQSDGWNVSPPSFKVSQLSLEVWPGEVRLQTSRAPESLQDNKDFRWEPVSEYEMQNFAMLTGYSGRIVVNYLLHLFFLHNFITCCGQKLTQIPSNSTNIRRYNISTDFCKNMTCWEITTGRNFVPTSVWPPDTPSK